MADSTSILEDQDRILALQFAQFDETADTETDEATINQDPSWALAIQLAFEADASSDELNESDVDSFRLEASARLRENLTSQNSEPAPPYALLVAPPEAQPAVQSSDHYDAVGIETYQTTRATQRYRAAFGTDRETTPRAMGPPPNYHDDHHIEASHAFVEQFNTQFTHAKAITSFSRSQSHAPREIRSVPTDHHSDRTSWFPPIVRVPPEMLLTIQDQLCYPDAFAFAMTCKSIFSSVTRTLPRSKSRYRGDLRMWHSRQSLSLRPTRAFCKVCLYFLPASYFGLEAQVSGHARIGVTEGHPRRLLTGRLSEEVLAAALGQSAGDSQVSRQASNAHTERDQMEQSEHTHDPMDVEHNDTDMGIVCTDCSDLRKRAQMGADGKKWTLAYPVWRRSTRVEIDGHSGLLWFRARE